MKKSFWIAQKGFTVAKKWFWMIHVIWWDVKEIITYEHDNWNAASQYYHGYFDNLAPERRHVREVLDVHDAVVHDAVVLEFLVTLAYNNNNYVVCEYICAHSKKSLFWFPTFKTL